MATAQLDVDSNKFNLPVVKASAGPDGIVVSKLRNDGWVTLDPGFLTTAQCESKIKIGRASCRERVLRLV